MKKITLCLLFLCHLANSQTVDSPLNVLFVGNSLTYFNNMPQTFESISNEQGYHVNVEQHTPGGTGFVHHVTSNVLYQKIREKIWDYVILQPGSNESPGFSYPINETIERGEKLRDSIIKYSPCASIHFYEISYGIVNNTPASFTQYQDRQTLIKNNLTQMAVETGIPFVPVGECFKTSMETDSSHFLWVNYNDIHPNAKGSYMAACSFYNGLFKNPIINTSELGGLSSIDATFIRNQAELVTLASLDDALINVYTSTANFDYVVNSTTNVSFVNTSSNFDSVYWDFGDGTTSIENNPNHSFDFNLNPSYTVLLTAYKDCKAHHKIIVLTQESLAINENIADGNVVLFPNPTNKNINIRLTSVSNFSIINIKGQLIRAGKLSYGNNRISLFGLSNGVYFLRLETNNGILVKKIIKE